MSEKHLAIILPHNGNYLRLEFGNFTTVDEAVESLKRTHTEEGIYWVVEVDYLKGVNATTSFVDIPEYPQEEAIHV